MKINLKNKIDKLDDKTKEFIHNNRFHLLSEFFDGITSLGSPVIIILVIGILWSIGESLPAKTLLLGLLISGTIVRAIKRLTNRKRLEKHLNVVFSEKSFPSGHTTSAFMTAVILNHFYNRPTAFFSLATTVAISRVHLEDHYLSDVLPEAITGILVSTAILM